MALYLATIFFFFLRPVGRTPDSLNEDLDGCFSRFDPNDLGDLLPSLWSLVAMLKRFSSGDISVVGGELDLVLASF